MINLSRYVSKRISLRVKNKTIKASVVDRYVCKFYGNMPSFHTSCYMQCSKVFKLCFKSCFYRFMQVLIYMGIGSRRQFFGETF